MKRRWKACSVDQAGWFIDHLTLFKRPTPLPGDFDSVAGYLCQLSRNSFQTNADDVKAGSRHRGEAFSRVIPADNGSLIMFAYSLRIYHEKTFNGSFGYLRISHSPQPYRCGRRRSPRPQTVPGTGRFGQAPG